ncbi:DUF4124 domain-containing protein [Duganella aceris]|uniref:DUF4124 domain-containing protein n=1 Tax=Duganella aceris TaxID=2703883 RepID=A0ABX0FI87_9BURK|nr:DUF4124 domain-containing protein [Duganella aceris]NGZ84236.1 DUF4124 domain-containing protein [Duganella aceris]
MPKLLLAVLLALSPLCHAEVYKWVDEKGVVNYTDNKFQAGQGKVAELKVAPPPPPAASAVAGPTWQQRDAEFRRLQQHKLMQPGYRPRTAAPAAQTPPKQASYRGGKIDTDASRCDLARDIKSDKLAHSNGMPIDANDLQTAENDIRRFCR